MNYRLAWLADVLRAADLTVVEEAGWKTRGAGDIDMGEPRGVLCHDTAGRPPPDDHPSLPVVIAGRADLPGPLAQLFLARSGTWHVVAAGKANHAGAGMWNGVWAGNTHFIGVEAENQGVAGTDPWPDVQVESFAKGVAAILKKIGAPSGMCAGHKEYALPRGRKVDPDFDMDAFRARVSAIMLTPKPAPVESGPQARA